MSYHLPSGRTLQDVSTGVTVNDRSTERADARFMADRLRQLLEKQVVNEQVPVTEVVEWEVCRHDDDGYLVSRFKSKRLTVDVGSLELGPLYAKPVSPKPVEVTDELLTVLKKVTNDYRSLRKSYNELAMFDGNPTWDDEGIESESLAAIVNLGGGK